MSRSGAHVSPKKFSGPVAQLVEHRTFNAVVAGSSPARLTIQTSIRDTILGSGLGQACGAEPKGFEHSQYFNESVQTLRLANIGIGVVKVGLFNVPE